MRNKISIDELVRQKIALGEESHNLGAWANMERMLDGKNPYQEKDEKKRRPWMFLLLGAILCSTAVIGGYNYLSKNPTSNPAQNSVAKTPSNSNNISPEAITTTSNNASSTSIEPDKITTSIAAVTSASNTTDDVIAASEKAASQTIQNQLSNSSNTPSTNRKSTNSGNTKRTRNYNNRTTANVLPGKNENIINASPKFANNVKNKKDNSKLQEQALAASEEIVSSAPIAKKSAAKKSNKPNKNNIPPTITEAFLDTTIVTEVTQKFKEDEFGQKSLMSDSFKYSLVKQKKRTIVNPRFVELTQEQEEAAQRRTALATTNTDLPSLIASSNLKANSPETIASKSATNPKESTSFFSFLKQASNSMNQKAINITHTKYPIYTGMFVGVNAAAINSKHNFGGFQAGFTAMTPLSRLLTLQAEARFIHKNNSGYTIKDSRNTVKNTFIDSTSIFKEKIYTYEIDSVSYGYNLKNFYTLQVPITLNANFDKFNVYGGVHLNYGFRMNINTASSSHAITRSDTVAVATNYQPFSHTDTKFTRDDFAHRFGLGYTVGTAYNINSQLSLDLRMSNLFWDNTKGAAKQEISNVFFRIPSFQLSLGYRFRAYEKAP